MILTNKKIATILKLAQAAKKPHKDDFPYGWYEREYVEIEHLPYQDQEFIESVTPDVVETMCNELIKLRMAEKGK